MTSLWETLPRHHAGLTDRQPVDWTRVAGYAAIFLFLGGFWYGVVRLAMWFGGVR